MEYRSLGQTGLKVSPLCLGAMMLGPWGNPDEADCIRIVHAALDAGINFIDTANVYSAGVSEEIVGKALAGRRDQVVLATKVWGRMGPGPNEQGLSRRHIRQQIEASLRRLNTDYVDLYQIHRPDPTTPVEETLRTLDDLVREGKVRYLGCSTSDSAPGGGGPWETTMYAWNMVDYIWTARLHGWEPFRSIQPPHSLLRREVEKEMFPAAVAHGMGIIPWSPLEGGWLTGKYRRGQAPPPQSRGARAPRPGFDPTNPGNAQRVDIVEQYLAVCEEAGVPLSQVAIRWQMDRPGVTSPIIGPRTLEQLQDNLGALEVQVPEALGRLADELVPVGTTIRGATG